MVHEPTRLDQDAAYVEQLGALRDLRDQPSKEPDHVTKAAQIEALTAEVSELHEQSTKVHDALRTVMATHTREMKEMEAASKRSMASSSLPRRAWRSCATRRLVVPNRRCRRRS
jgi:predicted  nucleic acid-binding Zn-ribbon protein